MGKANVKQAELVKSMVESIVTAKIMGVSFDAETASWLSKLGVDLHAKLAKTGIIESRDSRTLVTFLEAYMAERSDLKPRTRAKYATSIKSMVNFFRNIQLKDVTHEKAALYRVYLLQTGFREATISKMIGVARLFFRHCPPKKIY